MKKVLNFDQFMQEKNNDVIEVTVLGHTYEVPAEIPAIVPVMMARAENSTDQQHATKMVMRAADAMFGTKAVDEMCANGISASSLVTLMEQLFQKINSPVDDENDDSEEYTDEDSRKPVNANRGKGKK